MRECLLSRLKQGSAGQVSGGLGTLFLDTLLGERYKSVELLVGS
jgi:hypothetical protein